MSWLGDFIGSAADRESSVKDEEELEQNLDIIAVWLSDSKTNAIRKQDSAANKLLDLIVSRRNTIVARMRILKHAIIVYEQDSYNSVVSTKGSDGKLKATKTSIPGKPPAAINNVYNSFHSIDAFVDTLERDADTLYDLLSHGKETKKFEPHLALLVEAVKLFHNKFVVVERKVDKIIKDAVSKKK